MLSVDHKAEAQVDSCLVKCMSKVGNQSRSPLGVAAVPVALSPAAGQLLHARLAERPVWSIPRVRLLFQPLGASAATTWAGQQERPVDREESLVTLMLNLGRPGLQSPLVIAMRYQPVSFPSRRVLGVPSELTSMGEGVWYRPSQDNQGW